MPWCEDCAKFWSPNSLPVSGKCPTCGIQLAEPLGLADEDEDESRVAGFRHRLDEHVVCLLGAETGDGDQASHWAETPAVIGIMAADFAPGMIVDVKPPDSLAFDVIGWDPVPEPATPLLLAYTAVTAVGEAIGYALGGGRSLLRVR